MQRRTFLSLLALPAVTQLLQACGSDAASTSTTSGTGSTPTTDDNGAQISSVKGVASRVAATPQDALAASAAINAFSADLYHSLVRWETPTNVVFSPASIALALLMTSAGAKGDTLTEMDAVLHVTDPMAIHHSMNGLTTALAALNATKDNTADGGTGTSQVELSIANSLWGQTGFAFEQTFLDLLSSEYDAGLELVDYTADPEAARAAINAWVADETKDRIPELLGAGSITPEARLTLVNAIYLKANWLDRFEADLTTDEPFAAPGGQVTVHMMHTTHHLGYAANDELWQAVDIPYVFGGLSFTALMTAEPEDVIPTVDEVAAALEYRMVELSLPKFDIETSTSLAEALSALGMPTAFTDAADFSGMTTTEPLQIGDVIHQANITLDEEGTEAAAATAVVMVATGAPVEEDPVQVVLDRPFTFWLRDTQTGTVVFAGRITDPSATRG